MALCDGNPVTPINGAIYEADTDRYAPLYGPVNSDQIQIFISWTFVSTENGFISVASHGYLDIRNAYNRANANELDYNFDYPAPGGMKSVIPSFGLRENFDDSLRIDLTGGFGYFWRLQERL